jgi:hypothetical protein
VVGYANPRIGTAYRDRVLDASRAFGKRDVLFLPLLILRARKPEKRITKGLNTLLPQAKTRSNRTTA